MTTGGRPRHPKKEIEAAIRYAEARGWVCSKAGAHAHAWGRLYCPFGQRGGCQFTILSTPRSPHDVASDMIRRVNRCRH